MINKKYPGVRALKKKARQRLPHFAWEYLDGGIGEDLGKRHNRSSLHAIKLLPSYLHSDRREIRLQTEILGQKFDAPFGVAPIGLGGLMWPKVAEYLAAAAKQRNIPFCLSTFATTTQAKIADIAGENAWFQLYRPNDDAVREKVISKAEQAGFNTMLLTVDIPLMTRRERELAVGLSVPPSLNIQTLWHMMLKPEWCLASLLHGIPSFHILEEHVPANLDQAGAARYVSEIIQGHLSVEHLQELRDRWKGKLLIKGLLSLRDVQRARDLGYDGVVVSNHGGRQLESAPSAIDMLPILRHHFPDYTLLADGGVRSGADIAKMLALGADMVLCGRAMMYGGCAAGRAGADQVMTILYEELHQTLGQLGIKNISQLPDCVYTSPQV